MALHQFEMSNDDKRHLDNVFEAGTLATVTPVILSAARMWHRLQNEIRIGAAVILVKEGCECGDLEWGERAIEDAARVTAEAARQL